MFFFKVKFAAGKEEIGERGRLLTWSGLAAMFLFVVFVGVYQCDICILQPWIMLDLEKKYAMSQLYIRQDKIMVNLT